MACILNPPREGMKGVVTFTHLERDKFILKSTELRKAIERMKQKYVVGLHHNFCDFKFKYDPLFDFSMAGEGDLREATGADFTQLLMDSSNFVPAPFKVNPHEKTWDILYVARAVFFKRIPEFFQCVRALYDQGRQYRILFICPVPPFDKTESENAFYDIRKVYDSMFNQKEQDLFTLLTIDFRYPFPLDMTTLAHFYRSSRVFVHFADNERRARVGAYAWACGMPVIAMTCVGTLLPKALRKPPFYYEVQDYTKFPEEIMRVLDQRLDEQDLSTVVAEFAHDRTIKALDDNLMEVFQKRDLPYERGRLYDQNLDIRLSRHHSVKSGLNSLTMTLNEFIDYLMNASSEDFERLYQSEDQERSLSDVSTEHEFGDGLGQLQWLYSRLKRLPRGRFRRLLKTLLSKTEN